MTFREKVEGLAEKLHEWYLEATKALKPESYNPNAQKKYSELTEEQKFIDRFIADKILSLLPSEEGADNTLVKEVVSMDCPYCGKGAVGVIAERRFGHPVMGEELKDRRWFCAELAGSNSCVDGERKAKLFMKFRQMAKELQEKYHALSEKWGGK